MTEEKMNAEVLSVLLALGPEYIEKVPESMITHLTNHCDKGAMVSIDDNIPIQEQPISKEAKTFLAMLKLQYWCNSNEERKSMFEKEGGNKK